MRDIDKARRLFDQAKLAFPAIPSELAAQIRQHGKWLFSTRDLTTSPYDLHYYVDEAEWPQGDDYAVLSHSGHSVNSYAIQYYIVLGGLRMFLHLGWGGVYMDADAAASKIAECFSLADKVVAVAASKLEADARLLVVGSDFYGSYWLKPGQKRQKARRPLVPPAEAPAVSDGYDDGAIIDLPAMEVPADILREVVLWLEESDRTNNRCC